MKVLYTPSKENDINAIDKLICDTIVTIHVPMFEVESFNIKLSDFDYDLCRDIRVESNLCAGMLRLKNFECSDKRLQELFKYAPANGLAFYIKK